jgi:hypothetical protein|tara:strand:+ start:308 stop:727 length:420 start_codon:yes stop_codon:yes gene_type:complete
MAFFRGEEGSVAFAAAGGTPGAITSTTAWSMDLSKDTLECTAHGDTARKYVGSLISGTGSADLLYTAASGDETANILSDIITTEDPADAKFHLFLDTSGNKKLEFNGIITGASLSSTVGDISTVSISFQMSGAPTAFDL